MPVALSSGTNYIAKHSSNIYNPSKTISSSYYGPTSLAKEVSNEGMSLRPRMVKDTLSKLQFFYFETIKMLLYNILLFLFKRTFLLDVYISQRVFIFLSFFRV